MGARILGRVHHGAGVWVVDAIRVRMRSNRCTAGLEVELDLKSGVKLSKGSHDGTHILALAEGFAIDRFYFGNVHCRFPTLFQPSSMKRKKRWKDPRNETS